MDGGYEYDGRFAELERDAGAGAGGEFFFLRSRALRAAAFFLLWGASGVILGAVPDLSISIGHLLLCFAFLMAGVALLTLTVADDDAARDPRFPVAARAAAALEGWLLAML